MSQPKCQLITDAQGNLSEKNQAWPRVSQTSNVSGIGPIVTAGIFFYHLLLLLILYSHCFKQAP